MGRPAGAPTRWDRKKRTEDLMSREGGIDEICDHVVQGHGLRDFCVKHDLNRRNLMNWIEACPERRAKYENALENAADVLVEYATACFDMCERDQEGNLTGPGVNLAKYRSDNFKWLAARLKPKLYGDKQQIEVTQNISISSALQEARARVGQTYDAKAIKKEIEDKFNTRMNERVINPIESLSE